jgi:hypothetical protein
MVPKVFLFARRAKNQHHNASHILLLKASLMIRALRLLAATCMIYARTARNLHLLVKGPQAKNNVRFHASVLFVKTVLYLLNLLLQRQIKKCLSLNSKRKHCIIVVPLKLFLTSLAQVSVKKPLKDKTHNYLEI